MKANIGVSEKNKQGVADLLNVLLADESILYVKTRNFHWNVTGPNFFGLHNLLEQQYDELAIMIDDIAERVRQLGHYALGTMEGYLKAAHLLETSNHEDLTAANMLKILVDDHETIIRTIRKDIIDNEKLKDNVTADFVTGLAEKHEKMVWMLRSSVS